ncbi:MAG: hypothetical protein WBP47_19435 [Candidatus Promineifilaceae bacterium]
MNETRSSEVAHTRALCRVCTPSLFPNLAQLNNSLIALAYLVAKPKAFLCFEDGVAEIFAVESLPARCPERLAWSEKLPVTSYVVGQGLIGNGIWPMCHLQIETPIKEEL